jgi:microcystin-dependent protein
MKRLTFLSATGAAVLTGCGGHHAVGALPGLQNSTITQPPNSKLALKLVPQVADPIPAGVLANPIIGEVRRFDGATAPPGWILMQGQEIPIAQNQRLFSILGHPIGDKSTTTFKLPKTAFGMAVAAAGVFVTSPRMLSQTRTTSYQTSLGPGALAVSPRPLKPPSAKTIEERRLIASAIVAKNSAPVQVSQELSDRIDGARADARAAAMEKLTPDNRAALESAVQAAVDGRSTVYDAVMQMTRRLEDDEATSLLTINDRMQRSFSDADFGVSHANPQREAANFLVSVTITPEQADTIAQRE